MQLRSCSEAPVSARLLLMRKKAEGVRFVFHFLSPQVSGPKVGGGKCKPESSGATLPA